MVLTDKAMEIIEAVNDRKQELGIDNEYIFSLKDQPASYDALKDLYPSYCSKLDITNRSSHKSRKTFVSSLIDGGVNINTVREMVGHNDERTTLSCYCFDRKTDAERKNMIRNALSSPKGSPIAVPGHHRTSFRSSLQPISRRLRLDFLGKPCK